MQTPPVVPLAPADPNPQPTPPTPVEPVTPVEPAQPAEPVAPVEPVASTAPSGFNWGAFWLTWIWGIFHGVWVSILLIPLTLALTLTSFTSAIGGAVIGGTAASVNTGVQMVIYIIYLAISIWFGIKGTAWAWNRRGNRDLLIFQKREKRWALFGWIIGVLAVLASILSAAQQANPSQATTECSEGLSFTIDGVEQCPNADEATAEGVTEINTTSSAEIALGESSTQENVKVTVLSVNNAPTTEGDAPDAGKHYLQINLSATNLGTSMKSVPGNFVYKTASGEELNTVTTFSSSSTTMPKDVQLTDKKMFVAVFLDSQETSDDSALLFEVPVGDVGSLLWKDGDLRDEKTWTTFLLQ